MSESEIKRRQDYKRIRKKWIIIQAIALVFALVVALASYLVYDSMNRTYYIEYTESGSADYKVQYKENSFFDDEWVGSGQSYVSELVSGIYADFSYALKMDTANVGFDYTYDVVAQLIIADKTTGDHIYDPKDVLLPEATGSVVKSDSFTVSKNIFIDYNKYNNLAQSFVDIYSLKNATRTLLVTMNVNVLSSCNEFEENNSNLYSVTLKIPLGEDNFSITTTSSVADGESKVLACKGTINQKLFLNAAVVSVIIAAILGLALLIFVYATKNDDVNYTIKVQKLVRAYRSFIQQMDGEFNTTGYQVIPIKTFNEMLGIRDTIQSPVLMSENRDQTKTQFLIPTNTKLLYVFEIKIDNYDEIYSKIAEAESKNTNDDILDLEETAAVMEDVSVEETVEEAVEETPVEEIVEEVIEEAPVEEIVEEVIEEVPVEEIVEEVIEEAPVEEIVEEVIEEAPVEEIVEEVIEEASVEEIVEEVIEEAPVEEIIEEAVEETPVEETVEEVIEEAPVEEIVEEVIEEAPVVDAPSTDPITTLNDEAVRIINGEIVHIRYRTSFMSRFIQADNEIQKYYGEVKNFLLSYKGVKARSSWNFVSFNKGRQQCAKLNVKGNSLMVYLALNPSEYAESKYRFTDVSDKPNLDQVPMLLKVKNERSLKSALKLIAEMMSGLGIKKGEAPLVDYFMPYETTEALADRGLVKIILPKGIVINENTVIKKLNVGELLDALKISSPEQAPEIIEEVVEQIMSEPDVKLEQIDFVDEIDEEYEETPEHPGLEVVGVVWPERAHRNKIYKYDPNGEKLYDGDVVLVPTRDVAKSRDVVRKAAVAHGNHMIDPESHPHVLKKVICVIKRRSEDEEKK